MRKDKLVKTLHEDLCIHLLITILSFNIQFFKENLVSKPCI